MKKLLVGMMVLGLLLASSAVFAQEAAKAPASVSAAPAQEPVKAGLDEEQIKAIAVKAVQDKGIVFEEADIVYDEENALWEERVMAIEEAPADPNKGNLPGGVLAEKKYQVVFFDFADDAPTKDIWVFVDKDSGEVITLYQEK